MSDTLALNAVHVGDIRELAPRLAPHSVNCIVTSPPYFGLRDYGTARWEGGDADCDHIDERQRRAFGPANTLGPTGHLPETNAAGVAGVRQYRDHCGKCGAVRVDRQLGLEPTVGEFVANLVAVFRALRPALRDDGVIFCNLGDSYNTYTGNRGPAKGLNKNRHDALPDVPGGYGLSDKGLPPKCLTLAPARFAIAMVEDGWILRSEMTGIKVAPMPESVRDRPTSATEKLYMFVKQPRYWYDALAVAEPSVYPDDNRKARSTGAQKRVPTEMVAGIRPGSATYPTRNARNWFYWRPEPFSGSHYATFPSAIPRFAIRAGCPPRACARCGAPWVRETTCESVPKAKQTGRGWLVGIAGQDHWESGTPTHSGLGNPDTARVTTLGWRATCACDAGTVPGLVLDPFGGSGTTAMVAVEEGRRWLLCDLDPRAVDWTRQRLDGRQIRLGGLEAAGG